MFDGSFKASQKVNLSGRKQSPASTLSTSRGRAEPLLNSKTDLLLQNRLARENRRARKSRTAASIRIQACYRRHQTMKHSKTAVFHQLEEQVRQIRTKDIQPKPLSTRQLQVLVRQFLFSRPSTPVVVPDKIRHVQDFLVLLLLVNCLQGSLETGSNLLKAEKDMIWTYQVTKMSEIALYTVIQDEETKTVEEKRGRPLNPYLILLDTLTTESNYVALEATKALANVLYYLGVTTQYGVFDALRAWIASQAKDGLSRVENDRTAQVVARVTAQTLRLSLRNGEDRATNITREFAKTILLSAASVSSPIISHVMAMTLETEHLSDGEKIRKLGQFWASVVQHFRDDSMVSVLSWQKRAILVGNVIELTFMCLFDETLVGVIPFVISQLVTPSLVQWAFDVKHTQQDPMVAEENDDMDDDGQVSIVPPLYLSAGDFALDAALQHDAKSLGTAESSVRTQWQKLCHSNFSARCLYLLLRANESSPEPTQPDESVVSHFCHVLAIVLLYTGRSYMLAVAATFANPPSAVFALLSAMTIDAGGSTSPTTNTSLIKSMWQWINLRNKHITTQRLTASPANVPLVFTTSQLEVLLVFNVVYSHLLLGLVDETFYDGQWPLCLVDMEALVAFLKQFIYDMCWIVTRNNTLSVSNMDEKELVLFSTVVTSIKLFNQLYDRDCRRRFMPDGAWLWPSMPVIKEVVDLELMKEDGNHDAHAIYMLMNGKMSNLYARAALILVTIPQVLSFNERVQLFQKLLEDGKTQLGHVRDEFLQALHVQVKRDEIVDDSFNFFQQVCDTMSPAAFKMRVKVTFINEQGLEEAGVDGGGVFKEYMDNLTKMVFSPEYGFFLETDERLLYPNPGARYVVDTQKEALDRYRFLGRVLAKAVFENILVEPQFAAFFLNKLLGKFNYIDDLHSLDPELYTSLMRLKHYDGNVEDLALTFSVSEMEFGEVVSRNLVPDGADIPVTNENRIRYIHLMANYKLNVVSSIESAAFLKGFRDLIPGTWIQMFAPAELQMLIGGTATNIDIDDWELHTEYGGGYHASQRVIQWFWEIVRRDFTTEDRAALLKFITSCSRQPLLGFSKLVPQICIHQVRVEDDERLPSSATCMNLLKLPSYSSKESMRKKLLYAIRSNAGFDLS